MTVIAIIGTGALGARHLQALARLDCATSVHIVDPVAEARGRALAALNDAGGLKNGNVHEHAAPGELPSGTDIAIIATNARERRRAIEAALAAGARRLILEKVLFTRPADYTAVEQLLRQHGAAAWVNCVRRTYGGAPLLRKLLDGRPFRYRVEGAGWGLACNAVHHLDEIAYLAGSSALRLDGGRLDAGVLPSKRPGYVEVSGCLTGSLGSCTSLELICTDAPSSGDRMVTIEAEGVCVQVSQSSQAMIVREGGAQRTEPNPIPFQSQASADHVVALLEGRSPALPTYTEAADVHLELLRVLMEHMNRHNALSDPEECPIT